LAVLFDLAKQLQREANVIVHAGQPDADPATLEIQWRSLTVLADVLGLVPDAAVAIAGGGLDDGAIDALVAERTAAKAAKNFAEADRIRDELKAQGIVLIDQPGGKVIWHR
jgi:cysteinyl-tRNA synthetase